jgi:hypothetical protein
MADLIYCVDAPGKLDDYTFATNPMRTGFSLPAGEWFRIGQPRRAKMSLRVTASAANVNFAEPLQSRGAQVCK